MAVVNQPVGYIRTTNQALDALYLLTDGNTYATVQDANDAISPLVRHVGQFVNVANELYWYKYGIDNIADPDQGLIPVVTGTTLPNDSYYTTADFTTNTECQDASLAGLRYRLNWRGYGFLIPNTEWETLPDGGFNILIAGFNVNDDSNNTFQVECY